MSRREASRRNSLDPCTHQTEPPFRASFSLDLSLLVSFGFHLRDIRRTAIMRVGTATVRYRARGR